MGSARPVPGRTGDTCRPYGGLTQDRWGPSLVHVTPGALATGGPTQTAVVRFRVTLGAVRAVVQRVLSARVDVDAANVGAIGPGLLIFLGIAAGDTAAESQSLAGKVARLRIFDDAAGKFDRSVVDESGEALVVSQFTLIANTRKGNRPSFTEAARPEHAEPLYDAFCEALGELGVSVATGRFGARMTVTLENDGPVTLILEEQAAPGAVR